MEGSTGPKAAAPGWFAVGFERDLDPGRPTRVVVRSTGYVLVRLAGALRGFVDRCPHRAARLSDGRVVADRIECLYHGWTFGPDGRAGEIPQWPTGTPLPVRACLTPVALAIRDGIVFLHDGPAEPAAAEPPYPAAVGTGARRDFVIDLPYDADALVENVLDIAHIHVAHDGAVGGGWRELAGPIDFDFAPVRDDPADGAPGAGGFVAAFRTREGRGDAVTLAGATLEFRPPGLVRYAARHRDAARSSSLSLFATPMSTGSCRLVYRSVTARRSLLDRLLPTFVTHVGLCRLLEQDMAVVRGQAEELAADPRPLAALWLPIRTSDPPVLRFRRGIDALGPARGTRRGLTSPPDPGATAAPPVDTLTDRVRMHTRHCGPCRRALARARGIARAVDPLAFVALAAAVLVDGAPRAWLVGFALAAFLVARVARSIERQLSGVHPPRFRASRAR